MKKKHLYPLINIILTTLFFIPVNASSNPSFSPDKTVWYTYPATNWSKQCLHIGNGYMGASFYGGVEKEQFDIAEKTFWTGGPNVTPNYNYGIIEGGKDKIAMIRKAIKEGQIAVADSLSRKYMMGDYNGFGYYSMVGKLFLDFINPPEKVTDYVRGLDLDKSLGFVTYKAGNTTFKREYFCSYPDKSMVIHISSNTKGKVNFTIHQEIAQKVNTVNILNEREIEINGLIEGSGLNYCIRIKLINTGGEVHSEWGKLHVKNADNVTILYTVETEYSPNTTNFKGMNPKEETRKIMNLISGKTYDAIKSEHIQDYKNLFDRVSFSLTGDSELEKLPTNERIEQVKKGMTDDSALKALWFNMGRYSLISASRPGTLPSNLQGVWNGFEMAPWSGNYQSNINLQEMYWGCGPTNLPECQEGYIEWIQQLVEPGRKVAQSYYGTKGWVSHATGNIWGFTSPGVDLKWGMYPMGAAWHCRHLWDQYDFTRDVSYLKNTAYPIMKEAALFCMENLMEYNKEYIMTPSVSAEHGIEIKDGVHVTYSTTNGEVDANKIYQTPAFQDIEMVYDLFTNVIAASKILQTDNDFRKQITEARNKLAKLKIGKYGQLQEWITDDDNPRDHHRHISHLYALYPGEMISASKTPDLFSAAKKSLSMRGEGFIRDRWFYAGGNWSMAWRIACWARLLDGERAIRIFNLMIKETGFENMMTSQAENMQVDAMMATPGLFAEMIIQSHEGYMHLLPALPTEWPEGEAKGFVARGGYTVNIQWKYGQLTKAELTVPKGMSVPRLKINNKDLSANDKRISVKQQ